MSCLWRLSREPVHEDNSKNANPGTSRPRSRCLAQLDAVEVRAMLEALREAPGTKA